MDIIVSILDVLGYISLVIVLISAIITAYIWVKGILPAIIRLGNGLATRKIAIIASTDNSKSLFDLLTDSKLINPSNVITITKPKDFGRAESATLYVVQYGDMKTRIREILNLKKDNEAMIIYAPEQEGKISPKLMKLLDSKPNVSVNNFRGRLLNDVVSFMMTTTYDKK